MEVFRVQDDFLLRLRAHQVFRMVGVFIIHGGTLSGDAVFFQISFKFFETALFDDGGAGVHHMVSPAGAGAV